MTIKPPPYGTNTTLDETWTRGCLTCPGLGIKFALDKTSRYLSLKPLFLLSFTMPFGHTQKDLRFGGGYSLVGSFYGKREAHSSITICVSFSTKVTSFFGNNLLWGTLYFCLRKVWTDSGKHDWVDWPFWQSFATPQSFVTTVIQVLIEVYTRRCHSSLEALVTCVTLLKPQESVILLVATVEISGVPTS